MTAKSKGLPAPTGTSTFLALWRSLEGSLSFTPPELSGSPNHTLYLSKLRTPQKCRAPPLSLS